MHAYTNPANDVEEEFDYEDDDVIESRDTSIRIVISPNTDSEPDPPNEDPSPPPSYEEYIKSETMKTTSL